MYNVISNLKEFEKYIFEHLEILKSSRRLYFNYCYESTAKKGHWHSDIWNGNASGILLKMENRFFVLTAKHCLDIADINQNESPIWVDVKSHSLKKETIHQYLFSGGIWNIKTLVPSSSFKSCLVDGKDLALIEMFKPHPFYEPDIFIDITDKTSCISKDELDEDDLLVVSGYPAHLNQYYYEGCPDGYTHRTDVHRQWLIGKYKKEDDCGHIELINYNEDIKLKGFSGGLVIKFCSDKSKQKLVGLITSGHKNIIRFIPIWLVIDALLNFEEATFKKLDPRFGLNLEDVISQDYNGDITDFFISQSEYLLEKKYSPEEYNELKSRLNNR